VAWWFLGRTRNCSRVDGKTEVRRANKGGCGSIKREHCEKMGQTIGSTFAKPRLMTKRVSGNKRTGGAKFCGKRGVSKGYKGKGASRYRAHTILPVGGRETTKMGTWNGEHCGISRKHQRVKKRAICPITKPRPTTRKVGETPWAKSLSA